MTLPHLAYGISSASRIDCARPSALVAPALCLAPGAESLTERPAQWVRGGVFVLLRESGPAG